MFFFFFGIAPMFYSSNLIMIALQIYYSLYSHVNTSLTSVFSVIAVVNLTLIDLPGLTKVAVGMLVCLFLIFN